MNHPHMGIYNKEREMSRFMEMMDRTFTVKTWGVFFTDEFGRKIELDGIEDMGHALEVYEIALYKGWTDIVMYETFTQKSIVKCETHP